MGDKDKDWMNKIEDGKMSALPTLETPHAGHSHPYTCIPEEASVDSPPNVVGGQPPVGPVGMGKPPTVQEINDGMGKLLQSMNSIDPVTTTGQFRTSSFLKKGVVIMTSSFVFSLYKFLNFLIVN